MALVVSSAALPLDVRPLLGPDVTYRAPRAGSYSRAELLRQLAEADGLIALLRVEVDEELLEAAPRLAVVANFAVGYDNVDVAACTRRQVLVANTPDVLTEATADMTFALLLAAARRIPEGDRMCRGGAWSGWEPDQLLGFDVAGAVLGVIGLGRIGQAVARRARGFDMRVLYAGPRPSPAAAEIGARMVALPELLGDSDFVTLHCPLTEGTRDLIDAAALAAMKRSAILVNTARGGCVDEAALVEALERGEIGGAALDVFAEEPAISPGLCASERTVLAPHAGSATHAARRRMAELCATAVRKVLDGVRPENAVNPEVVVSRRPARPPEGAR